MDVVLLKSKIMSLYGQSSCRYKWNGGKQKFCKKAGHNLGFSALNSAIVQTMHENIELFFKQVNTTGTS